MSEYTLKNINNDAAQIQSGTWIMLMGADKIPPHLVFIHEGFYFSLSVNGSKIAEPIESLLRTINARELKCLLFDVDLSSSKVSNKKEMITRYFEHFVEPEEGKTTCLYPIRSVLSELLNHYFEKNQFVFDLYLQLKKLNLTGKSVHLNMQQLFDEEQGFTLSTYTLEDIDRCILNLKELHVEG